MATSTNPVKAIRAKCLDCCCGSELEVKLCPCEDCPLHPYRFGKNPFRAKRQYSEDAKKQMAERLAQARANGRADSKE